MTDAEFHTKFCPRTTMGADYSCDCGGDLDYAKARLASQDAEILRLRGVIQEARGLMNDGREMAALTLLTQTQFDGTPAPQDAVIVPRGLLERLECCDCQEATADGDSAFKELRALLGAPTPSKE